MIEMTAGETVPGRMAGRDPIVHRAVVARSKGILEGPFGHRLEDGLSVIVHREVEDPARSQELEHRRNEARKVEQIQEGMCDEDVVLPTVCPGNNFAYVPDGKPD